MGARVNVKDECFNMYALYF